MAETPIEEMIESFKERYPSGFNLYSNPSVDSVLTEYANLKNSGHHSDEIDARLLAYERYVIENSMDTRTEYPYMECPFFTPEEVKQFKGYYAESGIESYEDYFGESMTAQLADSHKSHDGRTWNQRITQLQTQLQYTQDDEEADRIRQNILDLGWNPEVEYNTENQILATKRYMSIMENRLPQVSIVDIQSIIENETLQPVFTESSDTDSAHIHPVSIVLVHGKSQIAKVIKAVTKSEFTHSAIALDGNYSRLYSYNFNNHRNKGGGFSLESVKRYPPFSRVGIFTFFINDEDYKKLKERVQYLVGAIDHTHYGVMNLLLFPFKNIRFEGSDNMICSQFVDSCMKLINIDITGTSSSKVSPAMLYDVSVGNAKIYKTYDGLVKDFNQEKASQFLKKLVNTAKSIKSEASIDNYLYPVVVEAKSISDINESDIFITSDPYPDFATEYDISHNHLIESYQTHDTESMKHELAKLYYMNYMLEHNMYHNKFIRYKEQNMKTRAKVLREFSTCLGTIMEAEHDFDFGEYYKTTSFYPHTIEAY